MCDLHINAAESVDDIDEAVKVDHRVAVDLDAEVRFDGLDGQLGTAEGVGGVDFVVAVAGDINIGVTLERGKLELLVAVVDRHQDHGVGPAVLVLALVVLAEQHDVEYFAVLQELSLTDGQLCTVAVQLPDRGSGGAGLSAVFARVRIIA